MSINCPSEIYEGGLVAQKVSNSSFSCPKRGSGANYDNRPDDNASQSVIMDWYNQIIGSSGSTNNNYCEFRDDPTMDTKYPRIEVFYWQIRNAHEARYSVSNQNGGNQFLRLWVNGIENNGRVDFDLKAGDNLTVELALATGSAKVNYQTNSNDTIAAISYGRAATGSLSSDWRRCDVTIIDDDNSAYVGGLKKHPYGGTWMKNKACFERDCARDDSNPAFN